MSGGTPFNTSVLVTAARLALARLELFKDFSFTFGIQCHVIYLALNLPRVDATLHLVESLSVQIYRQVHVTLR